MYQYLVLGSYSILVSGILVVLNNGSSLDRKTIDEALRIL